MNFYLLVVYLIYISCEIKLRNDKKYAERDTLMSEREDHWWGGEVRFRNEKRRSLTWFMATSDGEVRSLFLKYSSVKRCSTLTVSLRSLRRISRKLSCCNRFLDPTIAYISFNEYKICILFISLSNIKIDEEKSIYIIIDIPKQNLWSYRIISQLITFKTISPYI